MKSALLRLQGGLRTNDLRVMSCARKNCGDWRIVLFAESPCKYSYSFLFFSQHDFDKVQILSSTGFHGSAVTNRIHILLP